MPNPDQPAAGKPHSRFAALSAGLRSVLRRLPAPRSLVELRCARHLDRVARRLQRMLAGIETMSGHLAGVTDGDRARAADEDGNLRRMLAGLRDEVALMRCDLARWYQRECGGSSGARLSTALARLNRIAADTHAAALRLEGELEERARTGAQGC